MPVFIIGDEYSGIYWRYQRLKAHTYARNAVIKVKTILRDMFEVKLTTELAIRIRNNKYVYTQHSDVHRSLLKRD